MFNVCTRCYFYRNDPPGKSISFATEELLQLSEASPQGLPMTDFSIKDLTVREQITCQKILKSKIQNFSCVLCPNFEEHVSGWIQCLPLSAKYFQ